VEHKKWDRRYSFYNTPMFFSLFFFFPFVLQNYLDLRCLGLELPLVKVSSPILFHVNKKKNFNLKNKNLLLIQKKKKKKVFMHSLCKADKYM
jgi:hypothetical protein